MKDRLFFFGDYQGYRQTEGYPTNFTVPTASRVDGRLLRAFPRLFTIR